MAKSYTYDAYGNTTITDNNTNIVNSFAYAKAVIDNETGLYYMNARYYDPETGRFISQDTYRGTGEAFWHLYLYCDDDPVNHIDPSGHWLLDAVFLAADVVSFIKKPSLGKALWIVADLFCFLDPTGVASTLAHAGKVAKVAKAAVILKGKKIVQAAKALKNTIKETKIVKSITGAGKAFSGGKAGEKYLASLVGGKSQAYFKTSTGARYIDQLSKGVAHESKVGYTTLTSRVKSQILKDAELIKDKSIKGATWHFFKSADTGKIGASKQLLNFLKDNGIKYKIHY